ncbi:hypothetical protein J6590_052340 [Homalodisca vitripennis]|nr:hypothetical protein J6590_052340 [Homalodisca vitripennis]
MSPAPPTASARRAITRCQDMLRFANAILESPRPDHNNTKPRQCYNLQQPVNNGADRLVSGAVDHSCCRKAAFSRLLPILKVGFEMADCLADAHQGMSPGLQIIGVLGAGVYLPVTYDHSDNAPVTNVSPCPVPT